MIFISKKERGFTLIELLVVIAIIGLLSSVVLANLDSARKKARDSQRRSDLRQIELALELHYTKHGSYTWPELIPLDCSTGTGNSACGTGTDWGPTSDLRDVVTDGFMDRLPVDPINNSVYRYTYEVWNAGQAYAGSPGGQAYDLCATLEMGGTFCVRKRQ